MTDNIFEKYEHQQEYPIQIDFSLTDKEIMNLLKGVEFNSICAIGGHGKPLQRIHVRIFSSDREQSISWKNWRKLIAACTTPELQQIIWEIRNESNSI